MRVRFFQLALLAAATTHPSRQSDHHKDQKRKLTLIKPVNVKFIESETVALSFKPKR
jgi:hypothetical protein